MGKRVRNANGVEIDIDCDGVYFFYAESLGLMKIGVSRNIAKRFRQLQQGFPAVLTVFQVIEGDDVVEKECHQTFAGVRVRGEWFTATPDLLEHVREYVPGAYFDVSKWAGSERPGKVSFDEWVAGVRPEGLRA